MNDTDQKVLLFVLAHPDDESFGWGGTIAYYSTKGVDVHLLCATRGEAGTVDPHHLENYNTIAELREAELACAAKALGLKSYTFLGFRDSGMPGSPDNEHENALFKAPVEDVAVRIVEHIRRLRPQVVVTFDPVGGYHHPDHVAVHNAAVRAFHAAGDAVQFPDRGPAWRPEKLYYNALNRRRLRFIVATMRLTGKDPTKVGRNKDIDLTVLTRDKDTPRHVTINYRSVYDRKLAADHCHSSQLDGRWSRFSLLDLYFRVTGYRDHYTRAYPLEKDNFHGTDLFSD